MKVKENTKRMALRFLIFRTAFQSKSVLKLALVSEAIQRIKNVKFFVFRM
jgi:hypothetical protein